MYINFTNFNVQETRDVRVIHEPLIDPSHPIYVLDAFLCKFDFVVRDVCDIELSTLPEPSI